MLGLILKKSFNLGDVVKIKDDQTRANYMEPSESKGKHSQRPKTADDQD